MIIYLVERSPNGTSKRVPASTLYSYMEQMNVKSQLQQLGVIMAVSRTALTPAQLKQLLHNPPAGTRALAHYYGRSPRNSSDAVFVCRCGSHHLGTGQSGQSRSREVRLH